MINKVIKNKFTIIFLFNTMYLSCHGSNVDEYRENLSDGKQIIIHKSMENNDFYQEIANLYLENNETETINIQTYPAQWPSSNDFNFLQYYLPNNTTLKSLTLKNCGLTKKDANYIWEGLRYNANFSLETLDLSHNSFCYSDISGPYNDLGASFGAAMQTTGTLREVRLDNINLESCHINSVAAAFTVNASVSTLSLCFDKIGDFGAMQLSKMLNFNQSLEILDLSHNNITSYGLKILTVGLKNNTSLKELILKGNHISENDINSIGTAAKNEIFKF